MRSTKLRLAIVAAAVSSFAFGMPAAQASPSVTATPASAPVAGNDHSGHHGGHHGRRHHGGHRFGHDRFFGGGFSPFFFGSGFFGFDECDFFFDFESRLICELID